MKRNKNILAEEDISLFCLQTAYLLKAGVPLYDGLATGMDEVKNKKVKEVFIKIGDSVLMQNTLAQSIRDTEAFPEYVCSMVELGEMSGRLEDVLTSLSEYYDKEKRIKSQLRQAVTYPASLFCIMSVVVSVLVFKVLPMFENVFRQLGGAVSDSAGAMMRFGKTAGILSLAFILLILASAGLVIAYSRKESGRAKLEKLSVKLPFVKDIVSKSAAVRFASSMSLALSSGAGLDESMEMAAKITENSIVREKIDEARGLIYSGISFGEVLDKANIFPAMFSRIAGIGMKTGNLEGSMKKLSGIYADELEESVGNLIATVEPVLVGIIALVVGMILISVLLPLTGVMASIG
ncbi:MAG: type II secretion system F family protein [Clostridia bacterium]|nr:type II secretion system F family protein [Clostridia bacterium]MBR5265069.1 type II secretion system F family protein [Clostridia bacterium]